MMPIISAMMPIISTSSRKNSVSSELW